MAKHSTPPKPTQQPTPRTSLQRPTPAPPRQPTPTPQSPKKAVRLHETIQRLTKVATRRLALQPSPCPEVLSPQVTARRVGPPPTAVSPPSPMQLDKSANSSTSSRFDSSSKMIDTHPVAPDDMKETQVNVRIRCMQRFMDKGWKQRKIWYNKEFKGYCIKLTRPNRDHSIILYRLSATIATVFKGPDSKYHVPDYYGDHTNFINDCSHNECKRSLPISREEIIRELATTPLYRAYPPDNQH